MCLLRFDHGKRRKGGRLCGDTISFDVLGPNIALLLSHTPEPNVVGNTVYFTATGVTDGTPLTYAWDYGDGESGTGEFTNHDYDTDGAFTHRDPLHSGTLRMFPYSRVAHMAHQNVGSQMLQGYVWAFGNPQWIAGIYTGANVIWTRFFNQSGELSALEIPRMVLNRNLDVEIKGQAADFA